MTNNILILTVLLLAPRPTKGVGGWGPDKVFREGISTGPSDNQKGQQT